MLRIRKYDLKLSPAAPKRKCNAACGHPVELVLVARGQTLEPVNRKCGEPIMREWHKPTVEETESGMEVTSYLPAELDRA